MFGLRHAVRRGGASLAVAFGLAVSAPAHAQLTSYEREVGQQILGTLHYFLDSLYYDSTFGGADVAELWWRARNAILEANSASEMLISIAQSIQGLDDSHTWFIPPSLTNIAEYRWRWQTIGDACFAMEVDRGSDAWDNGLRPGDQVLSIDGIDPTRKNLEIIDYVYHELQPRAGMRLRVQHVDGSEEEIAFRSRIRRVPPVQDVADLETRRRLTYVAAQSVRIEHKWRTIDSVAVWRFTAFGFEDRRIDRYMQRARERPWFIIDLRRNPGGAIEAMTRLLGHFIDSTVVAYTEQWRDSSIAHEITPRGRDGPYRGNTIVLLDSESASAAEITAHVLRALGKATIMGDRSAGAVRQSQVIPLYVGSEARYYVFGLSVSVSGLSMSDGTVLEGRGVEPDSLILPTGGDIAARRDPVMQRALAMAGIEMSAEDAARIGR